MGPPRLGVLHTRLEWADTDAAGIHHNSVVNRFVEGAEAQLVREAGMDGYFPVAPRVRFEADYEAPLFFGQEITAVVWVERVGTSSLGFAFEVWGEEHQGRPRVRAASGRYVTVHVPGGHDGASGRSAPWPEGWLTALAGDRGPGS
jgi:acyl-CoA thioester hydrolase